MAIAIGWGLFLSTGLCLILIPCVYRIFDDFSKLLFKKPLGTGHAIEAHSSRSPTSPRSTAWPPGAERSAGLRRCCFFFSLSLCLLLPQQRSTRGKPRALWDAWESHRFVKVDAPCVTPSVLTAGDRAAAGGLPRPDSRANAR